MWINKKFVYQVGNNKKVINKYGRFRVLIFLFKIPMGTQKDFFEIYIQFGLVPSKWFTSPVTVTTLQSGRPRHRRFPQGPRDFYLLRNVQTSFGTRPASYSMGTGRPLPGWSGRGVKPTNHLHKMPRLRICETIPPFTYTPSWYAQGQHYLHLYRFYASPH